MCEPIDQRSKKALLPALLLLVAAACSKGPPTTAAAVQEVIAQPATAVPAGVSATKFAVTPQSIHAGQPVTVHIELQNVSPQTAVTIGWFGPDHWNIVDQTVPPGPNVNLQAPVKEFTRPGTYEAHLRAGNRALGQTTVTITG